jgi:hypothetical protein
MGLPSRQSQFSAARVTLSNASSWSNATVLVGDWRKSEYGISSPAAMLPRICFTVNLSFAGAKSWLVIGEPLSKSIRSGSIMRDRRRIGVTRDLTPHFAPQYLRICRIHRIDNVFFVSSVLRL